VVLEVLSEEDQVMLQVQELDLPLSTLTSLPEALEVLVPEVPEAVVVPVLEVPVALELVDSCSTES